MHGSNNSVVNPNIAATASNGRWHSNRLNTLDRLRRRERPFIGTEGFTRLACLYCQTCARSLASIFVRPEVQSVLLVKFMFDLPPHLTISSSRSLRSLGRAKARLLT